MKSYEKKFHFKCLLIVASINITHQLETCVNESGIQEGIVLANSMHVTSSVFIDDEEEGLFRHYEQWLEKIAPSFICRRV